MSVSGRSVATCECVSERWQLLKVDVGIAPAQRAQEKSKEKHAEDEVEHGGKHEGVVNEEHHLDTEKHGRCRDAEVVAPASLIGYTECTNASGENDELDQASRREERHDGDASIEVAEQDGSLQSLWLTRVEPLHGSHVVILPALSTKRVTRLGADMERVVAHEEEHRDLTGGAQRAAVFGVSDGLVTNVSLILGFAGAHPVGSLVRLAGIAGMVAGAFSMAAGEYVSMQAQRELFERELAIERRALAEDPDLERAELIGIYRSKGIDEALASELASVMMRSPELALETHAREELGVDPSAIGSPWRASAISMATFAFGALLPLLPWFFISGTLAIVWSIIVGAVASLAVGAMLGHFTGRSRVFSACRQLAVATVAAGVTYGVGRAVGSSGV